MALISLRNVGFTYAYTAKPALRRISIDIERGQLYGIVGANGSGKSTLCHVIRGTVPRFYPGDLSGQVVFRDRRIGDWSADELSSAIGYVFQNPFTQISGIKDTVFEEIALGLENLGVDRDAVLERTRRVIDEVGIGPLAARNPNELSGGQRQLVAFAAIIAMDAEVIVIDEPTSQLDPETSEAVFGIIGTLRDRGKTIVLVEHDMDLLAEYADHIIVMTRGEIVGAGPAHDVLVSGQLAMAEVRPPQVTELGLELQRAGKSLASLPTTRAEAGNLIRARMQREVRGVH